MTSQIRCLYCWRDAPAAPNLGDAVKLAADLGFWFGHDIDHGGSFACVDCKNALHEPRPLRAEDWVTGSGEVA